MNFRIVLLFHKNLIEFPTFINFPIENLAIFSKFIENFPTVFDLAGADEQTVLKTWQGLGYYSRARNLHYTAKKIASMKCYMHVVLEFHG